MLTVTILTALFINGALILFDKWCVIEWLQMRVKSDFIYKMIGCNFCLSHHLALIVVLCLPDFNYLYLSIPLMVAGLIHAIK